MKYYFAPMEGVTGFVYRQAHREQYSGVDRYYAPFVSPNQHHSFKSKEKEDIAPENNEGYTLIPQILSNHVEEFLWAAKELETRGYKEVNLNLGCPSGTVTAKGRGAGFLAKPEELDAFLEAIFAQSPIAISIKTRLGMEDPREIFPLLDIYNKYPATELIIHPRVRAEFYKGVPHKEVFAEVLKRTDLPICFNGNLFTMEDLARFEEEFPQVDRVMIGRGLIANPGLVDDYRTGSRPDKYKMKAMHDRILNHYLEQVSGAHNTIYKMKELWFYQIHMFADAKKYEKKIRKSQRLEEYLEIVDGLFRDLEIAEKSGFPG